MASSVVHFLTIVLDGMPWLPVQLAMLNQLNLNWRWHIVEGVAENKHCTKWCKPINARFSMDGTTEFLDHLLRHDRIFVHRKLGWDGKIEMVNEPLRESHRPGLVWQMDSDEIWQPWQLEHMIGMFAGNPAKTHAQFKCRYFFGPDIIITSKNTYGNRSDIEWYRVWRWRYGQLFSAHEPPVMIGSNSNPFTADETEKEGLVFDHYAYATEEQVAFKETYYGYKGAVAAWRRLQENTKWPAKLKDFIPWVKDETIVDKIWNT